MIAERIKQLRNVANMSQSELARKLQITRSSINAWEQGISTPSTQMIIELAQLFHVSTDYILGFSYESDNTIHLDNLTEEEKCLIFQLLAYIYSTHKNS